MENIKVEALKEAKELVEDIKELLDTEIYFIGLGDSRKEREAKEELEDVIFILSETINKFQND